MVRLFTQSLAFALLAFGCAPTLDDDLSRVKGLRLLAVATETAEAKPGETVAFEALVVDERGPVLDPAPSWAFCVERKPLAELGPVSQRCLEHSGEQFIGLGQGLIVEGTVPKGNINRSDGTPVDVDACQLFGPQLPPGSSGGRPVDPDPTGGFYQPLRLLLEPDRAGSPAALAQLRITCPPTGLNQEQAAAFAHAFRANRAPRANALAVSVNDGEPGVPSGPIEVAIGDRVGVFLSFPSCSVSDACADATCSGATLSAECPSDCFDGNACAGAERYAWIEPSTKQIQLRRELLDVAWYSNGGNWANSHSSVNSDDANPTARNSWHSSASGDFWFWIVVRDDRGGTSWISQQIRVSGR